MKMKAAVLGGLMLLATACSGTSEQEVAGTELKGADETLAAPSSAPSGCVTATALMETAAPLNLREAPTADARILLVMPEGTQLSAASGESCPQNGYYKVRFGGFQGWAYSAYLRMETGTLESGLSYANTRDDAIARARAGVGFSYWWGHGRFLESGPTSSTAGSCSGSCPSCSHYGSYGGDCSGFAAKVWVVPGTNNVLSTDSHPYSTYNFENEYHDWHDVARGSLQKADAMVYNADGAGHIFIYEKGDPWGSMYAYECKGCSEGCVYGIRTAGSAYKPISRDNIVNSASYGSHLYSVVRTNTGSGKLEVHVLNRATNYQSFIMQKATVEGYSGTDGSWTFRMADYNGDGTLDIWGIGKANTGSGKTEIHILNGADYFQSYLLHVATILPATGSDYRWVFGVGDFNSDGRNDLYAINKSNTGSGKTEVHVLNGATNFQSYALQAATGSAYLGTDNLHMVDLADYDGDGRLDLWIIAKSSTGSGKTELHILSASSNFSTYVAHVATALAPAGTDLEWTFNVQDYNGDGRPDLYAIDKYSTGTGRTEVHILNGATNFQSFLLHSASAHGYTGTDGRWLFDM